MIDETVLEQLRDDGWTVDDDALSGLEQDLVLSSPDDLEALLSPVRLRMLGLLARRPSSAKELAVAMDVPTTRLYHHVSPLAEHGVIRVVATRRSGARTEQCYGAVRGRASISPDLLQGHADEVAAAVAKIVSLAGENAAAAVRTDRLRIDDESTDGFLTFMTARLTKEQRSAFFDELTDLVGRIGAASQANSSAGDDGAEAMILSFVATPDVTFAAPTER